MLCSEKDLVDNFYFTFCEKRMIPSPNWESQHHLCCLACTPRTVAAIRSPRDYRCFLDGHGSISVSRVVDSIPKFSFAGSSNWLWIMEQIDGKMAHTWPILPRWVAKMDRNSYWYAKCMQLWFNLIVAILELAGKLLRDPWYIPTVQGPQGQKERARRQSLFDAWLMSMYFRLFQ